jgi:hypothetical protein
VSTVSRPKSIIHVVISKLSQRCTELRHSFWWCFYLFPKQNNISRSDLRYRCEGFEGNSAYERELYALYKIRIQVHRSTYCKIKTYMY